MENFLWRLEIYIFFNDKLFSILRKLDSSWIITTWPGCLSLNSSKVSHNQMVSTISQRKGRPVRQVSMCKTIQCNGARSETTKNENKTCPNADFNHKLAVSILINPNSFKIPLFKLKGIPKYYQYFP